MFKLALVFGLVTLTVANFQEDCLKAHNNYRSKHSAPPLELDVNMQQVAQKNAIILANGKIPDYSGQVFGQNEFFMRGSTDVSAKTVVETWYNEKSKYSWRNPRLSDATAHFTQVVWKGSSRLGCAYFINGNDIYVVASYNPPGNTAGEFKENVSKN